VVVMTKNRQNPAYSGARIGADRVAARFGCTRTHAVPKRSDDVDEQHRLARAVYAERPDVHCACACHPSQ
jgi:ribose transport system substrate-binding protein